MNCIPEIIVKQREQTTHLSCTIETSFSNLDSLRDKWDKFILSINGDIYFSYDWCEIWWKHYKGSRELKIFIFKDMGDLVGIVPMFIDKVGLGPVSLKLAKIIGSDFTLSVLRVPVTDIYSEQILKTVLRDLIYNKKCDAVWFGPIAGTDPSIDCLRNICKREYDSKVCLIRDCKISCYTEFDLPDNFETYLKSLPKKERQGYRRSLKNLKKNHTITETAFSDPGEVVEQFTLFRDLHDNQWKKINKLGHFLDWPNATEFNSELVQVLSKKKRVRVIGITADSEMISSSYRYFFGFNCNARLTARDNSKMWSRFQLGRVGFIVFVMAAIEEGITRIEAGQGHYPYKLKLGGKEYPLQSVLISSNCFSAKLRAYTFVTLSNLLNVIYYKIWFCRIAPKLPFKMRRPLWKLWIRSKI